jgi:hypothetical protein
MELDLDTILQQIAGVSKEKAIARQVRGQATQPNPVLQEATQRGGALDMLNFAATAGSNNEGLANAVSALAKSRRAASAPVKMGETGFAVPDTGQFVENPNYTQEKDDARSQGLVQALMAAQERARMSAERNDVTRESIEQRREAARERNALMSAVAAMRRDVAGSKPDDKPIPAKVVSDITKLDVTGASENLLSEFKPEFVVPTVTGGIANTVGRTALGQALGVGSSPETVNWWQNYNDMKNLYRNRLFGSALTKTEGAAFDKANVLEGDSEVTIRTKLAQQHAQAVKAYNKLVSNYAKAGYKVDDWMKPDFEPPKPGTLAAPASAASGWSIQRVP